MLREPPRYGPCLAERPRNGWPDRVAWWGPMRDHLGRDLGLYAVFTISVGAMIGSGIFVLPGLAMAIAGPAVALAYLLAGLVVLPAAFSKAEMATSMPHAGGTYLFIDRALGPGAGTVAGLGAWFSLVFKSAFALVGLGAYLTLFMGDVRVDLVALALGAGLIAVNVLGVRQVGRLQALIVTLVLGVLVLFVATGSVTVQRTNFEGFFAGGAGGLLAATGFVFVAYAGVTKIASIAEEVDDPGRTIPLGMLLSIGVMMIVYTAVAFVLVGVSDPATIVTSTTPMAHAARAILGPPAATVVSVTAVLALTSMANAGILSASRYPFAMSRDRLLPARLARIQPRVRTPVMAIAATGGAVLLLIAFVPVVELAKLASTFQLLVFAFVNVAVIVFRESNPASYQPTFRSPAYPWMQIFGIAAPIVLIPFMGVDALLASLAMAAAGIAWYLLYGRARTRREGAAIDALRGRADRRNLAELHDAMARPDARDVVLALPADLSPERIEPLLRLATDLAEPATARIRVLRLLEMPVQATLEAGAQLARQREADWDEDLASLDLPGRADVRQEELVSHDRKRALANYLRAEGADMLVADLPGEDARWLLRHVACDAVFVENGGYRGADEIVAIGGRGPLDPVTARTANRLATRLGARLHVLRAVGRRSLRRRWVANEAYQAELRHAFSSPDVTSATLRASPSSRTLLQEAAGAQLAVVDAQAPLYRAVPVLTWPAWRLAKRLGCTVLIVHAPLAPGRSRLGVALERLLH